MDLLSYRVFLAGLGLAPVIAAASAPAGVVLAGAGSVVAGVTSFRLRPGRATPDRVMLPLSLLRPAVLNRPPADLPGHPERRELLARALAGAASIDHTGPTTRDAAIAQVLRRAMEGLPDHDLRRLPASEVLTLYLLDQVLRASPGEAGRLAQLFQIPGDILTLREEIDRIARRRSVFDRDRSAFLATDMLWQRQRSEAPPRSPAGSLSALGVPDIDLWHHVVCRADLADRDQRAAALWCLSQPDCDRATVAAFFARLVTEELLPAMADAADGPVLVAIRQVVEAWNGGTYRGAELAAQDRTALEPRLSTSLDRVAAITGGRRWPDPHGIFAPCDGRSARPRPAWDLPACRLRRAPELPDYVETGYVRV